MICPILLKRPFRSFWQVLYIIIKWRRLPKSSFLAGRQKLHHPPLHPPTRRRRTSFFFDKISTGSAKFLGKKMGARGRQCFFGKPSTVKIEFCCAKILVFEILGKRTFIQWVFGFQKDVNFKKCVGNCSLSMSMAPFSRIRSSVMCHMYSLVCKKSIWFSPEGLMRARVVSSKKS